jgi:RNA polymerase sigma-70 factor, ECF subfamily
MCAQGDITELVSGLSQGDAGAADRLTPVLYEELRGIADRLMRQERVDHTLQPTALVNEAYLRLVDQTRVDWQGRMHFLAVAATVMRRILVDHARGRNRQKRQGDRQRVMLDSNMPAGAPPMDLLDVDDALKVLRKLDGQQHRIAELRLFGGLETKEVALILGVSELAVRREWRMASKWLAGQLSGQGR